MLITLKQKEIVSAITLSLANGGISLAGKTVDVTFTAGRKESGLTAEVSIEDDGSKALDPVTTVAAVAPAQVSLVATTEGVGLAEAPAAEAAPDTAAPVVSLFG